MSLRSTILRILKEQLDQNTTNIKNKYVGVGKPMTEQDFAKLIEVTGGKFYLLSWLAKKVGQNIIKAEDIYKYKEYFDIYEKNKNKGKFQHKDIHLYKTAEDVLNFLDEVIKVREGDIQFEETLGKDNYVSPNDIRKLEQSGGIKYLGIFDGYQVFQINSVKKDVWKLYRDILGKCKGRSKGARIDICTIGGYYYFKKYLEDPKFSSYFLLYNLDDPKSPYQLHYETGQFMDKNDSSRIGIDELKFFEWVGKRVPQYSLEREDFPGNFTIPAPNKGRRDQSGKKQGTWRHFENGKISSIINYVNGKLKGPFQYFHEYPTKLQSMGTYGPDEKVFGEYTKFTEDGQLEKKGEFGLNAQRIGIWYDRNWDIGYTITNYDVQPYSVSGYTKDGGLRYITSTKRNDSIEFEPVGDTILFFKSGNVQSMGKIGTRGKKLGNWVYYFPDGTIKAEGRFVNGYRQGQWTDVVKTKTGKKIILVAAFVDDFPNKKVKIYNARGEFIEKKNWRDINSVAYWDKLNRMKFN